MDSSTELNEIDKPSTWPGRKKLFVVFVGLLSTFNAVFDSSIPSGASEKLAAHFGVDSTIQLVLPISLFLVGYILGPLLWGPLSEMYGRRCVLVPSFAVLTIFSLATALAPNWPAFLIFRFICGTCASSALAIVGGIYSDIYGDPRARGRAMAVYLLTTVAGPQFAPIVSGFIVKLGWNWPYWIAFFVDAVSLIPIVFLPETYLPALQLQHIKKVNDPSLHASTIKPFGYTTLVRPIRLLFLELTCSLICLFLSYASAIFFLFFEAYPLIFQDMYHLSSGITGLAFLPIALGGCIGFLIAMYWDNVFQRASLNSAEWTMKREYRRLPLACIGGPLYVISLLWLGWTSRPSIHPICPMFAGVPFGAGFFLIFTALLNYLADVYTAQAASALAAGSCARSVFGAVLPLAAPAMYARLGISWASTLLACLSLLMSAIPFAFLKWGSNLTPKVVHQQNLERVPIATYSAESKVF